MVQAIERDIRYLGSSDVAYAYRKMLGEVPAGVSVHEMINDFAEQFKIDFKHDPSSLQPIGKVLILLAKHKFEESFLKLSTTEQYQAIKGCLSAGMGKKQAKKALNEMKTKGSLTQGLASLCGEENAIDLVQQTINLALQNHATILTSGSTILTFLVAQLSKEGATKILLR